MSKPPWTLGLFSLSAIFVCPHVARLDTFSALFFDLSQAGQAAGLTVRFQEQDDDGLVAPIVRQQHQTATVALRLDNVV
jgi:hypothetical protein